jgi:transcriptional regulator
MEIWGKNTIKLFTSFMSQVRKKLDQGESILLFLLKLINKKLYKKEGKVNTKYHIGWPLAREKNMDTGENIDTE